MRPAPRVSLRLTSGRSQLRSPRSSSISPFTTHTLVGLQLRLTLTRTLAVVSLRLLLLSWPAVGLIVIPLSLHASYTVSPRVMPVAGCLRFDFSGWAYGRNVLISVSLAQRYAFGQSCCDSLQEPLIAFSSSGDER